MMPSNLHFGSKKEKANEEESNPDDDRDRLPFGDGFLRWPAEPSFWKWQFRDDRDERGYDGLCADNDDPWSGLDDVHHDNDDSRDLRFLHDGNDDGFFGYGRFIRNGFVRFFPFLG